MLREMADSDPTMYSEYADGLPIGLGSTVYNDRMNALYGLANLKTEPPDLRSRLNAHRKQSTNSREISRIGQALKKIGKTDSGQP